MESNYIILFDENGQPYLSHHGIKGQKWGVRRYQNPDGTLTEVGKQRLKTAAKVGLVMAGAAAVAYGGYKLNNIAVDSLQKKDLEFASEWVQRQNIFTETVDEKFHESLRLRTVIRNGENLGDKAAEAARHYMSLAEGASEMYKYYANRARRKDYDIYDRFEEIKSLLGKK